MLSIVEPSDPWPTAQTILPREETDRFFDLEITWIYSHGIADSDFTLCYTLRLKT